MNLLIGYLLMVPGVMITVALHEYVKAMASTALGDTLPRRDGRCTLNPIKHVDPLGFIIMLLFGFGWGKPVDTSPMFYKDRKKCTLIVYILPSVANVLLALLSLGLSLLLSRLLDGATGVAATVLLYASVICRYCAKLSLTFALFNIVPVYPLDGAKVLSVFLKPQTTIKLAQYEKILQMIMVFLIILGIFSQITDPIVNAFINIRI